MSDTRNHIIAFSGGKDSSAMALRLRELHPEIDFEFVCTPTGDELPDMLEHLVRMQELLGKRLTVLGAGVSLGGLIERWNALPNWRMRWCTRVLKIEPFQTYLAAKLPATIYIGFRADEADARDGVEYGEGVERRFPMIDWGWDKAQVYRYLNERGVQVPERTDCGACFFQTLGEWHTLWRTHPDRYALYEEWEAKVGHTFRSPSRDTQPAGLRQLREKFEAGYTPRRTTMSDRKVMCSTCAR